MMDQQKDIHNKHSEWMSDVYDWVYKADKDEKHVVMEDEEATNIDHNAMFKEGIEKIEKINKEKSINSDI